MGKKVGFVGIWIIGAATSPAHPPRQDLNLLAEGFGNFFGINRVFPVTLSDFIKGERIDGNRRRFFRIKGLSEKSKK
jgi:hypothetical protein